ncbi:MAG TPA: M28 family peptidase [Nitrolancea sp.]|nr:M28 family peptidase [Nitrolancea sp.]
MTAGQSNNLEAQLIDAVSADELMDSTRAIAQWVRLSGTEEEAKAFDWIEAKLKGFGLTTHRYAHPGLVSWPESASLELLTDGGAQSIPCATHAFAASTPAGGLEGELVAVGRATAENLAKANIQGKIALIDGIIAPNTNLLVEEAGAAAAIWIAGGRLHERGLDPIWGTPTPETSHLLPKTPSVSVKAGEGEQIKAALAKGPVRVRLQTDVYQDWRTLPLLTADLTPSGNTPEADLFVMFSGHVDSWYYGAMDNGTANATQLEVARLMSERKDDLYRGLRMAFWSGHSHGRYASSAWYADTFWHDLHERCAVHVNIDSVGAKNAVVLSEAPVMAETYAFARDVLKDTVDVDLDYRRMSRSSDQSFWGHGISSVLASLSEQGIEDSEMFKAMASLLGGGAKGGGLGWWWHTTEDTLDKIDDDNLVRDAGIYAETLWRLCTVDRLPLDMAALADEIGDAIDGYIGAANGTLDLSGTKELASTLAARIRDTDLTKAPAARANQLLLDLGRQLVPVNFTANGPFEQDLALGTQPVPGLREVAQLATLDPASDDFRFLKTKLIRQRNRIEHALRASLRLVAEFNG